MSLRSRLDNLTPEQRRRLFHAFNNKITQYVKLPGGKFIGVNMLILSFTIEEEVGVWSFGSTNEN